MFLDVGTGLGTIVEPPDIAIKVVNGVLAIGVASGTINCFGDFIVTAIDLAAATVKSDSFRKDNCPFDK